MTSWIVTPSDFSFEHQHTISHEQYQEFRRIYSVWYKLADMRFGQAFCHHFSITDGLLESFTSEEYCQTRIRTCWLER